jgi:hypothetical protein
MAQSQVKFDLSEIDFSQFKLSKKDIGDLYKHPDKNTPDVLTIDEPSLDRVINVSMNEVGYLDDTVKQDYLQTQGLADCVGAHYHNPARRFQALMHSSGNFRDQAQKFGYFVRCKMDGRVGIDDSVKLLKSAGFGSDEYIGMVRDALNQYGFNNIEVIDGPEDHTGISSMNVIYDRDGNINWLNPDSIKGWGDISEAEADLRIVLMKNNWEVRCTNDSRSLTNPFDEMNQNMRYTPMLEPE